MYRPCCIASIVVLAAFGSPLSASQRIDMVAGATTEIEFIEHLESAPPTGWFPISFRIINRAPNAREWRVWIESDVGTGLNQLGEWVLRVAGTETREINLFVPQPWFPTVGAYFQLRGRVTGPGVANGGIYINRNYGSGNQTSFTGMSHALAAENWSRLEAELDPSKTGAAHSGSGTELAGSRFDPAQLPADWRTWSGFATIWLTREDWIGLTGVQRLALLRWVAQGGDLYVAGSGAGLEDLPPTGHQFGNFIDGGDSTWPLAALGLGQIHLVPLETQSEPAPRLPIDKVATTIRAHRITSPALAQLNNEITATEAETALGTIRPGGPLLGLLIAAIAILLGPVNIFLLAPARRRARLFVTVPLISFGGAVALVALILLQDGTGGHGKRGVLIALLPDRPEALVLQEQCAMTGLLFNRDFPLPDDTTFIDYTENLADRSYHPSPQRAARTGLNRAGPQITGDWFTSRTVHAHHLRTFVPTRAALTLSQDANDSAPSVLSTCPGVLRDLIVSDAQGRKWWAAEVAPGRSVVLEPAGALITERWTEQLHRFGVSLAPVALQDKLPLSFHASVDSWDETVPVPTLPSVRWRDDMILVTGPVREGKGP